MEDVNEYGQEWQVRDSEPTLFQTVRFPQHPEVCTMPSPRVVSQLRHRLSESSAEELEGKDDCVFDVMATSDLEMAMAGSYSY
jgi:hypothetical protein